VGLNWPEVLDDLLEGRDLDRAVAEMALGEIMDGDVDPVVTAAFLVALRAKGETAEEVVGLAETMRAHALSVDVEGPLLDIVGTGGDRAGTVNVSTMAALVCAGAGIRVAKHGNRAASSECGSADVLEALGVRIDLPPEGVAACIEEVGMGFCFAPVFHPAMRHVIPVRRAMGLRTVFNYLGPLTNPARATRMVVGVPSRGVGEIAAHALVGLGVETAFVVHGHDGLDELTTTGANEVWEVRAGTVHRTVVDPEDLGIGRSSLDRLKGADAATNAAVVRDVLGGSEGPVRDLVVLNAGAGMLAAGAAGWPKALESARESIDSGDAAKTLDRLIEVSSRLGG